MKTKRYTIKKKFETIIYIYLWRGVPGGCLVMVLSFHSCQKIEANRRAVCIELPRIITFGQKSVFFLQTLFTAASIQRGR